ncbi:hypothetical protein ASC87_07445 [Rhizobacter sp. Root1221]|nr:HipA domain-containing protein [Rhizobacter sp. Root1221]KQV85513.1 hypothetical protein ASC87_07445 [Rhizobacter sp. Root1221]
MRELWSRIVFNMLVSNTDDHLRNHGFILVPGSQGLKLNVSEADNAMDLDLARSVAPYFRVSRKLADEVVSRSQAVVKQWPKIADSLKVRAREQERMASAFQLAG